MIGQDDFLTTFSATDPSSSRSKPDRPWLPITIRSASSVCARASISLRTSGAQRATKSTGTGWRSRAGERLHTLDQQLAVGIRERDTRHLHVRHIREHVEHGDARPVPPGDGHRMMQCTVRALGEIDRAQNAIDLNHAWRSFACTSSAHAECHGAGRETGCDFAISTCGDESRRAN